ncbi:MAG: flagellin [Actinomycetia bacterium]|jgi:flagellin|nr:flagellin [Actinomycetes bacterium]
MGLRINQNIAAMNAYRNLSINSDAMSSSLEKLSSGFRINRAADDPAGLSISEGLRAQTGGLKVAVRNAQDAVGVIQTAEGALTETHAILQRMRDLSVQASNGGSQDSDAQAAANTEFGQLQTEIDRIANTTSFGNQKLLDGSYNGTFQVGADNTASNQINVDMSTATLTTTLASTGNTGLTSAGLGVDAASADLSSTANAQAAITKVDAAIKSVSTVRATLGAYQNRFEHTINNINVAVENLSASESRIRDTDMAQEMVNMTRSNILSQAGQSMLSQANSAPQQVLQLLRG